ncbi:MAG: UDP-N-acetylmuramoyl-L-alanine--D-glutamate ligase [Sphingomonadaceae bacterium]|nr:UDP-N-acetylmuramoyl-L-alanine--D-glutamate ligase [Sphingomonadaceae bacterium]
MIASKAFGGKRYAVLGLARSGQSVVRCLWRSGASVVAWDDREEARMAIGDMAGLADPMEIDLSDFDAVVVSPGVPLNRHPIAGRAREAGVPVIGDIELFAQARPELPPHKVVGITGTNGKSTTAALIHHIIKTAGTPALLGGNIGVPVLGEEPLDEGGVYVLELSSFQIDLTQSLDCDVAILLNITPDHLDRYDGFEEYARSKARLFQMQSDDRAKIIAIDDVASQAIAATAKGKVIQVSAGGCMDQSGWPALQGPHNAQNAVVAMRAARELGMSEEAISQGLASFPGLPHRMERVADRNGVLYVNDSKATNPTSTAPALAAFPAIHWILGGQAKTENLDPCKPHYGHVRAAYTIGEAGEMFANLLEPHMPVRNCIRLRDAVKLASDIAIPGETVLLSPACASFDQYDDFEARGDDFRGIVGGLL